MKRFTQYLASKGLLFEMGRIVRGDYDSPVSWSMVAQHLHDTCCSMARRNQDCMHPSCRESMELANIADAASMQPPERDDIERMIRKINSKKCDIARQGSTCNHPACAKHNRVIEWLSEQL